MARTLEEWDKLARARYLKFAKNPDCKKCPLGFDSSGTRYYRKYQSMLEDLYNKDSCCCCIHILDTTMLGCPCHVYGKEEAFKILLTWRERL